MIFESVIIGIYSSLLHLFINNIFIFGCCKHFIGYFLFIHKYYCKEGYLCIKKYDHMSLIFLLDAMSEGLLYTLFSLFTKSIFLLSLFFHVLLENSNLKKYNSI